MITSLLIIVLILAGFSLVLNGAYVLHELGWFPHGKRRDVATVKRVMYMQGDVPTIEELRRNNRDVQTNGPYSLKMRKYAHADVYKYEDPVGQLRSAFNKYKQSPTPSTRDDVLNLMNEITTTQQLSSELDTVVEEIISGTQAKSLTDVSMR